MKKILSLILALVLILSLSATAFASQIADQTAEVKGTYHADSSGTVVYSVDVTWEGLSFTYNEAVKGTWDPASHQYTGSAPAGWAEGEGTITVTNHSNGAITATPSYAAAVGFQTASMSFSTEALEVASAEQTHQEVTGTITVKPQGTLPETANDAVIGIITITIE